jgi:hypothetical protein
LLSLNALGGEVDYCSDTQVGEIAKVAGIAKTARIENPQRAIYPHVHQPNPRAWLCIDEREAYARRPSHLSSTPDRPHHLQSLLIFC